MSGPNIPFDSLEFNAGNLFNQKNINNSRNDANFLNNSSLNLDKNVSISSTPATNKPAEETLECQLCQKKIINRVKFFYI